MPVFANTDDYDRAILRLVQNDASLTHEAIGRSVNLSASSVRRRLAALKDAGIIEKEVALLSPEHAGVTLIVSVSFKEETADAYDQLDARVRDDPAVKQSYHVSGEEDYVLIVQAPSLQWYENWGREMFMTDPAIRRYSTKVVWSRKKFDTSIDV
ncbi:MAG: Lrp/AsnC family transcriptional regulator [Pseudomonadota bacterium]